MPHVPDAARRAAAVFSLAASAAAPARAQSALDALGIDAASGPVEGLSWGGFADVAFLLHALLTLVLAVALGAALAYHPRIRENVDTIDEAEAPKVAILYALLGAIIGIMVVRYGLVVGFVVFGIGGLFRFRTTVATAAGQIILASLVGLSCGLNLPHLGVLSAAFGWALTFALTATVTHQVTVDSLKRGALLDSAAAYRRVLEAHGASVIREERLPDKHRVRFVLQAPRRFDRAAAEAAFGAGVPDPLRGTVDWAVE